MEIVEPELESRRLAFAADGLLHVALDLLDDLLDAGRVDAAVADQPLDRLAGDLAAQRIEAGEDDRARRVVDDQLDAGRGLERADVASLAADDAALQVVARQIDDRDGRLDRVLGGAALDGVGDDLLGAAAAVSRASVSRRFTRLAASRRTSLSSCFSSSSRASSAVSPATRCSSRCRSPPAPRRAPSVAASAPRVGNRALAAAELLFEPVGRGQPVGERAGLVGELLFERRASPGAARAALLGFGGDGVRLFAGFDRGFLAQRVGVALGLLEAPGCWLRPAPGALDALAGVRGRFGRRPPPVLNWRGRKR